MIYINIDAKNKKNILITGSGSGLGKEAAIALAKRGHKVYATTHYEEEAIKLNKEAIDLNVDLKAFKLDITMEKDRNSILNYNINVYIANAAIGDSGSICEININRIKNVFETNVFSSIELLQLVMSKMIDNNVNGKIIFISSLVGRISMPFLSPYCASKFALEAFLSSLKLELKLIPYCNIQLGIIEPGAYATGFNKENNDKKYIWMEEKSYFKKIINKLKIYETKFWNFIEVKPYNSIISKYIKVVEKDKINFRYSAPKFQSFLIQLGRILGI